MKLATFCSWAVRAVLAVMKIIHTKKLKKGNCNFWLLIILYEATNGYTHTFKCIGQEI